MRMRPLSDRAIYLLLGAAVIVAVVLLAVVLASPAEGSEPSHPSPVPDVGVPIGADGHGAVGDAVSHASSFRDLIDRTPAEGDWRYYASGAATPAEYRWLLEVACGEVATPSGLHLVPALINQGNAGTSCWPVLWNHGLIDGDPDLCYYACGGWVTAEDFGAVENAFRAVLIAWGVPAEPTVAVASQPLGGGVGTPNADTLTGRSNVDRWHPLVAHYFPPSQVAAALRVMACESQGNPNAKNPRSSASGLFQHLGSYWPDRSARAGWAGADVFDPEANIAVAAWLWSQQGWRPWAASRSCWR